MFGEFVSLCVCMLCVCEFVCLCVCVFTTYRVFLGLKIFVTMLPIVVNIGELITGGGSKQWYSGSPVPCFNILL